MIKAYLRYHVAAKTRLQCCMTIQVVQDNGRICTSFHLERCEREGSGFHISNKTTNILGPVISVLNDKDKLST